MSQQVRGEVLNLQPTTLPASGNEGDVRLDVADGNIKKWDTSLLAWTTISGGAGGIAVEWGIAPGTAPLMDIAAGQPVFAFETSDTNISVYTTIRVPQTYQPGSQIFLRSTLFTADAGGANTATVNLSVFLTRPGTTPFIGPPLDTRNAGVTYTAAGTANVAQTVTLTATDASGDIGSTAVAAGDLLRLQISVNSFTLSDVLKMVANDSQVEF